MTKPRKLVLGILGVLITAAIGLALWAFARPDTWAVLEKMSWIVTLIGLPGGLAIACFQIVPAVRKRRAFITLSFDDRKEQLEAGFEPLERGPSQTKTFLIKSWVANSGNDTGREFALTYRFPREVTSEFLDQHVDVRSDSPTVLPTGDGFVREIEGQVVLVVHVTSLLPGMAMPVATWISAPTAMSTFAIACSVYTEHERRRDVTLTVRDGPIEIDQVQTPSIGRRLRGASATKRTVQERADVLPIVPEHIVASEPRPPE